MVLNQKVDRARAAGHRVRLEYKPVWGVYVGVEGPTQHAYLGMLALGVEQE